MAVPELVICAAGDSFKTYPGGVLAVAAADHLAGARGSLSTEADALSAGGTVVRDTQQVSNIRTAASTAYQAADDTLEITGVAVPFVDGRDYQVWLTVRTEGYTDLTDGALLRTHFHENWLNAGLGGFHTASEASHQKFTSALLPVAYYRAVLLGQETWFTGDSFFVRLAAESGTTIEWLLDQVFFFPVPNNATEFFHGTNTSLGTVAATQDGADGGDDNGKFTWFPREPADAITAPGDYQRKSDGDDAEYFSQVTTDDGLTMWFSPFGNEQGPAWMYSLHTAMHRGERVWTDDTFDNRDTTAAVQDMGISPEGFGYSIGSSANVPPNEAFVDGAGTAFLRTSFPLASIDINMGSGSTGVGTLNQGMKFLLYDQFDWSSTWKWTAGTLVTGGAVLRYLLPDGTFWSQPFVEFQVGPGAIWKIAHPVTGYGPDHDISSWFGINALVGIRIEVLRYRIRVKVWDASGAEPSTWDEEQFLEYAGAGGAAVYPYGDNETKSTRINAPFASLSVALVSMDGFQPDQIEVQILSWKVEHDPYGDPADMTVRMERPPGTPIGDQVVPFGSSYFVYWGKRDWTDNAFGDDYLAWSTKVWNDPAAAEIQRAEVGNYYFFWFDEPFTIVSMNWRSGDRRGSANRVLVGNG